MATQRLRPRQRERSSIDGQEPPSFDSRPLPSHERHTSSTRPGRPRDRAATPDPHDGWVTRPLRVKMILPALVEATSPGYHPIKYALFPPLGLAGLAGYLDPDVEVELVDEHVQTLDGNDEPDLVLMSVYITSARRAYRIADHYRARGAHVCLGGLHPSSRPDEAAAHADTIFIGPGEESWPRFLADLARGEPRPRYESSARTLGGLPPLRRDLIARGRYLCPNSLVVSRGCPHHCDFCYKDAFYEGGRSFGNRRFAEALFTGMEGMGRVFQGASTVNAILQTDLIERAATAGMRSIFVGFETVNEENLRLHTKQQNLARSSADGRIVSDDWERYDTRHVVYRPLRMTPGQLEAGYWRAYREYYRWHAIARGAAGQDTVRAAARHLTYSGGWKKLEPLWDLVIRAKRVGAMLPMLEHTLDAFGGASRTTRTPGSRAQIDHDGLQLRQPLHAEPAADTADAAR